MLYLTSQLALLNPLVDCRVLGNPSDWNNLPFNKSLFHSQPNCGLPIGNLTSQLFSNVYMNVFNQYVKRELHCHHYGRYVDDAYFVSADKEWLQCLIPQLKVFLQEQLGLQLHDGKIAIWDVRKGGEFLGAYLKPGRKYVRNTTLKRIRRKLPHVEKEKDPTRMMSTINSFLGVLGHYKSMKIQRSMFLNNSVFWRYGKFVKVERGVKYVLH